METRASLNRLENRVCIVTGSTGIGRATAALFHAAGAKLCVVGRDPDHLEALRGELEGIATVAVDLTQPAAPASVVQHCVKTFGRVDVLVNVAGISGRRFGDGPVHEATDAGWDAVMDTNAKTTFSMCREALQPMMTQGTGCIINMASVLAYAPNKDFFATHAYAACNGARIALTKSMAAYYAPHGIRVNAIAPGLIATPMSTRAQTDPAILEYMRVKQPITGSLGEASDCAEAIVYLVTAPFLTGVVLEVAGGWSVVG